MSNRRPATPGAALGAPLSVRTNFHSVHYHVDPIAGHTVVGVRARQHNGVSWSMPEMIQESAFTYPTSCSQRLRGDFQYLAERADCASSHPGCLIRARIRHHDDPQRVLPTGIAASLEDTGNAFGYRGSVIVRWNDYTNHLRSRG
jgi:hypothetical protein